MLRQSRFVDFAGFEPVREFVHIEHHGPLHDALDNVIVGWRFNIVLS